MNLLDFLVLVRNAVGIAVYGVWQTRGRRADYYAKGDRRGLGRHRPLGDGDSGQRGDLSTPGQGYQDGLGFVQNYFGAPIAAHHRSGLLADVPSPSTCTRRTSTSAAGSTRRPDF